MSCKRKITDFFDKIEGSSNKKTASFESSRDRPSTPSEHPPGSKHPGSTSISDSKAKEGSSISRRGTHTSNSDAKGSGVKSAYNLNGAKSAYNSNDVNLINNF